MVNALKQKVIVQSGGRIEIVAPELVEGSEAEVIVLIEDDDDGEMEGLVRIYDEAKAEIAASGEKPIPWEQAKTELERDAA